MQEASKAGINAMRRGHEVASTGSGGRAKKQMSCQAIYGNIMPVHVNIIIVQSLANAIDF